MKSSAAPLNHVVLMRPSGDQVERSGSQAPESRQIAQASMTDRMRASASGVAPWEPTGELAPRRPRGILGPGRVAVGHHDHPPYGRWVQELLFVGQDLCPHVRL